MWDIETLGIAACLLSIIPFDPTAQASAPFVPGDIAIEYKCLSVGWLTWLQTPLFKLEHDATVPNCPAFCR